MHRSARVFWNATREKDDKEAEIRTSRENKREKCAHVSAPETTAREIPNAQTDRALDGKTTFAYFPTARGPNDALAFEHISQRPRKRKNFTRAFPREWGEKQCPKPEFFFSLSIRAREKKARTRTRETDASARIALETIHRARIRRRTYHFFLTLKGCDVVLKLLLLFTQKKKCEEEAKQ